MYSGLDKHIFISHFITKAPYVMDRKDACLARCVFLFVGFSRHGIILSNDSSSNIYWQ